MVFVSAAMLFPIACGATLLVPSGGEFSTKTFWQDACRYGMTQVITEPAMLKRLLADADETFPRGRRPPVRLLWSTGAGLSADLHQEVKQRFGLDVHQVRHCQTPPQLWGIRQGFDVV